MLINLKIRNFILLKNLEIDFKNGLTVITGETGSGKSMIIDALRCFTQKRVNIESLGNNNENTQITALFDISQNLDAQNFCTENYIEFDDDVVILTVDESLIVKFNVALESQPLAFTPFQLYEPEIS